jgi:hypothetical protein
MDLLEQTPFDPRVRIPPSPELATQTEFASQSASNVTALRRDENPMRGFDHLAR